MRKRKRIYVEDIPYFVTVNLYQRMEIFSSEKWAKFMIEIIKEQQEKYHFKLHEFVVMPDHYHLILTPPIRFTVSDVLHHINGVFSTRYNQATGHKGRVIQPDFYDHGIRDEKDYEIKANYIHHNPVRAGLVKKAEDYPWSSARNRLLNDNSLIELNDI